MGNRKITKKNLLNSNCLNVNKLDHPTKAQTGRKTFKSCTLFTRDGIYIQQG